MTKKKKNPKRAGRKTKYHSDMPLIVQGLARDGLAEREIAEKLGVSVSTFEVWKSSKPEFLECLREGKKPVDTLVENALLKKALGYTYEEVTVVDKQIGSMLMRDTRTVTKHVQGDTTAQKYWLSNRRKAKWCDKIDIEHAGKISIVIDKDDERL